ncbi:MAG: hypothetical protein KAR39_12555, partial [Thermoplasmata archaeon]|nr:hypothetical protein [Thermoplasmata archaeon]
MTNYYIKNGGNDNNSGLSDAEAWETINKINSINFANGDTINLKRNSIFTDATLTLNAVSTGRSGITIQDYGVGNKPWINGNFVRPIVVDHALINLTLKNIEISGSDAVGFSRCHINGVNGLVIDGIDYDGHRGSSIYNRANGINVAYVDGDIEIMNCHIQNAYKDTMLNSIIAWGDLDAHGIILWYPGDDNVKLTGIVNIYDNVIHNVYADCIQIAGVHTTTNIYNNLLYHFGENVLDLKSSGHIHVYNNEMYHGDWGLANGGGHYGSSIIAAAAGGGKWTSQYSSRNNEVFNNYIHSTRWQGIAAIGKNSKIYNNYFKDIGISVVFGIYGGVEVFSNIFELTKPAADITTYANTPYEFDWSTRYTNVLLSAIRIMSIKKVPNSKIYNNTFYISSPNHLYGIAVQADADVDGTVIKNNIIYMTRNHAKVFPLYIEDYDNAGNLPVIDHNLLYGTHSNRVYIEEIYNGGWTTYDSSEQTAWRNAGHIGSLFVNPKFVNPSIRDFKLLSDSPAINAGVNVELTYDFTGTPIPQGPAPDIGAYEYLGYDPCAGVVCDN